MRLNETYLGDGVYAYHDGHQIWLITRRGPIDHQIALEPNTMEALKAYTKQFQDYSGG